jgi:hypothetical protein
MERDACCLIALNFLFTDGRDGSCHDCFNPNLAYFLTLIIITCLLSLPVSYSIVHEARDGTMLTVDS